MKNQIKKFGQFINENHGMGADVTIDLVLGESISNYAEMFAEMAKIAPNCTLDNILVGPQTIEFTFSGSEAECQQLSDYSNSLHGGEDSEINRYSGDDTDDLFKAQGGYRNYDGPDDGQFGEYYPEN
jgi:hypothetical protein